MDAPGAVLGFGGTFLGKGLHLLSHDRRRFERGLFAAIRVGP